MEEDTQINTKKYKEMFNKIALKDGFKIDEFYDGMFPKNLEYGMRIFKRKCMGRFGTRARKTLDELAIIFHDLGMTDSVAEAKYILPELGPFSGFYGEIRSLSITPSPKNGNLYLIQSSSLD